ncbi:hypothetical protein L211DRAFT_874268 [Terfezia boudieri ATCC MYA-4762]|uniref:Uncharacterized protein n=1 Tax=Terfezia boudieri ATCC MYA-4762 TaxID=1051890 RepID=A0A3N4LSL1_9PEZI|nr:hypothetical protein L211DRAFT_874268 [Terfezia boudieri ATCC MYA-4762]
MGSTDDPSSVRSTIPTQDNLSNSVPPRPTSSSRGPTATPSSSIPISSSTASTVTPSSSIPSASDPEKKQARDQRVVSLKSQVEYLQKQLDEVIVNQDEVNSKLKDPTNPEATVKRHIKTLHEFNEIRDIAQGLIGLPITNQPWIFLFQTDDPWGDQIAESRGVRVHDVYPGRYTESIYLREANANYFCQLGTEFGLDSDD